MPGDYFFLNYGVQDGNVMQGLFRVEKTTLELQVYNGTQWVAVAGGGGGSTSARAMSTVQRMAFIPASGALIWDTDLERLFIGNSLTAGGIDTTDTNVKSLTTVERMAIVPKQGELIWDTTLGTLFIGDGSTQGGVSIGGGGGSGIVAGIRLDFDGDTLNFNPVKEIVNVTGSNVTLQPDTAYKIYATTGAFNVTANPPAANYWGLEGHAEIFVGSVGYVVFDTSKIVLANQLEPDSVNNCTLRFHDGMCYISVEDHIAGYIVVNNSTSGEGSLAYGISTSTNDYVAFDASLNGQTISFAGAVANGEKHIVGNGYTSTTLTGAVDCGASKFTVANLALQNVAVNGGTITLGDAYIPSGSTVAVSGGGLAVEKVTGEGAESVIDLGGTNVVVSSGAVARASGCTFSGGLAAYGGAFYVYSGSLLLSSCTITRNNATTMGGGIALVNIYANATLQDCIVSGNSTSADIYAQYFDSLQITDCTIGSIRTIRGGIVLAEKNTIGRIYPNNINSAYCSVTLTSGAILNLTGNTNPTPIAPGGSVTISGGATIVYDNGGALQNPVSGTITLAAPTDSFTINDITNGGAFNSNNAIYYNKNATLTSMTIGTGQPVFLAATLTFNNCVFANSGRAAYLQKDCAITISGLCTLKGTSIYGMINPNGPSDTNTSITFLAGTTVSTRLTGSSNVFGAAALIVNDTLKIINVDESGTQIGSATVTSGTYTAINADGTTE